MNTEIQKVIRDGKVAVLVSRGFGAGWYSWHGKKELLFSPQIVELVEQGRRSEITEELCNSIIGKDEYVCILGVDGLSIEWLPIGTAFEIDDYDGAESLTTYDHLTLTA